MGKKGKRATKSAGQPREGTGAARRAKAATFRMIEPGLVELIDNLEVDLKNEDMFQPPAKLEDCPICFLPFGHFEVPTLYLSCCGKIICSACSVPSATAMKMAGHISNLPCEFCRAPNGNEAIVFERTRKRAEAGDVEGIYRLGNLLLKGIGVKKNFVAAMKQYITAASFNNAEALLCLSRECCVGENMTERIDLAKRLSILAAKLGRPQGNYQYGRLLSIEKPPDLPTSEFTDFGGLMTNHLSITNNYVHSARAVSHKALKALEELIDVHIAVKGATTQQITSTKKFLDETRIAQIKSMKSVWSERREQSKTLVD